MSKRCLGLAMCVVAVGGLTSAVLGQTSDLGRVLPTAVAYPVQPIEAVEVIDVPPIDLPKVEYEDELREADGLAPRFAIPWDVQITPATHGTWETLDAKTLLWRLRVFSPGAFSLNLGFTRYSMPHNGRLFVYAADYTDVIGPFDESDNETHGQLWTPVVLADDIIIEVTVPADAVDQLDLELGAINHGYRGFGAPDGDKSGSCNNDVICPIGDPWRAEIASVGVISTGGSTFCTGFMVNNTAQDQTPYFMTANHCGINSGNAASLVVYWNYESPTCGQHGGGSLSQYQTGSYFRAAYGTSDFTLVELDDQPNPAHAVTFAGWDHSGAEATTAVGIHHPNTDEKSISFEYDTTQTTSYLGTSVPGDGTHVRIIDWDDGTTEPGSSGSPLFDQDHHVIGQLHGGYAACGNNDSDWYGRFSRSWTGGGSNSSRLSNWLDPLGSGATSVDTLDPQAGMTVTPYAGLDASGSSGGPFAPSSVDYTVENQGDVAIDFVATKSEAWITLTNASGYLLPGATAIVTASINANANTLPDGLYTDSVSFSNTTDHKGDTARAVSLEVGGRSLAYTWKMDTDPGWSTEGQWAFGQPTGSGGEYGGPDPTGGYTGTNVYGYNLSGDYANNLAERDLTSEAFDCTNLTGVKLKFWRWLGVEQPSYDHAYVRVSNDGVTYTTIWENGSETADSSWTLQEFDISAYADGKSKVYIRWTMGTTDSSWRYCGWNIDDVEIWGFAAAQTCSEDIVPDGVIDMQDLAELLANYGQPGMGPEDGDIDGDGDIDISDLGQLLAVYGQSCPTH